MGELLVSQKVTISSIDIAGIVESRHDKVRQSIERLAKRNVIQLPPSGIVDDNQSVSPNSKTKVYLFSGEQGRRDSIIVVAQLSPEFTARLVDRWQELEAQAAKPVFNPASLTRMQLLEMAMQAETERLEAEAKVTTLSAQVEADRPKVEFAMAVRNLDDTCTIEEFAKTIGTGRNRFFQWLRSEGIVQPKSRLPYQRYLDLGWFKVVESKPWTDSDGKSHPNFVTRITGGGQAALEKRYRNKDRPHLSIVV